MAPKKEDQLGELVAEARELVSTLRGIQKDVRRDVNAARALLGKSIDDTVSQRVTDAVEVALKSMHEDLQRLQKRDMEVLRRNMNDAFKTLHDVAFGTGRNPGEYVKILSMIKAAAEALDAIEPDQENENKARLIIDRIINGVPAMDLRFRR